MKIVFLDIDGVLNYRYCQYAINGFVGIDPEKVKFLAKIIRATDAKIVLTSTWRDDYIKQNDLGKYLKDSLETENLAIYDCTTYHGLNRGQGISDWLDAHKDVESWVALDDEIFPDYEEFGVLPHLIKTSFYENGLESKHVWKAIALLNGSIFKTMVKKDTNYEPISD